MPRSPEADLISSVLRQQDMKTATAHGAVSDMFHSYNDEWMWLERYYRKYKRTPSKAAFKAKFADFRISLADDTAHFVDEVKKSHVKHILIGGINEAADSLGDGDLDLAMKKMQEAMLAGFAGIGGDADTDVLTDYTSVLDDVAARVRRVKETGSAGIRTGISKIDEETGGLMPGDLIVFSARLGSGKSWVMQSIAAHAAANGHRVLYDALEQTRAQVTMRLHSLLSGRSGKQVFKSRSLMQGKDFDFEEYKRFVRSLKNIIKGQIHVSDTARGLVSPLTVQGQIERWHPDIFFVDYLTLMKKSTSDWSGVAELPGQIKSLATRYEMPGVIAAQLNRQDGMGRGDEPPGAEALAGSDAIGQDADLVFTMKQLSKRIIALKCAKFRNGSAGWKCWIHFDPDAGALVDVSWQKAQRIMDQDADERDKEKD